MTGKSTRADVIAKIPSVFPDRVVDDVLAILDRYGTQPHEQEAPRLHLAILKLCDENPAADLTAYVETAKQDIRDILMWAEYPTLSKALRGEDEARIERAQARDQAAYDAWLGKK